MLLGEIVTSADAITKLSEHCVLFTLPRVEQYEFCRHWLMGRGQRLKQFLRLFPILMTQNGVLVE